MTNPLFEKLGGFYTLGCDEFPDKPTHAYLRGNSGRRRIWFLCAGLLYKGGLVPIGTEVDAPNRVHWHKVTDGRKYAKMIWSSDCLSDNYCQMTNYSLIQICRFKSANLFLTQRKDVFCRVSQHKTRVSKRQSSKLPQNCGQLACGHPKRPDISLDFGSPDSLWKNAQFERGPIFSKALCQKLRSISLFLLYSEIA